jgi:hypothetical protein
VLTGVASAHYHVAIATEPVTTIYCSMSPDSLIAEAGLTVEPSRAFPNLEMIRTDDQLAYFDAREIDGTPVSSPIQTWLELATGDKRTAEASEPLRARLLKEMTRRG